MNKRLAIIIAMAVVAVASGFAQTAMVNLPLIVGDNHGRLDTLFFGLDPVATDGIDSVLGEQRIPPLPPTGVFDARFVGDDIGISIGQGLWNDYRQGDIPFFGTVLHEVRYQPGSLATTITLSWDLPGWASGRLQDVVTNGGLIDVTMAGVGFYTVTNPSGLSKLKMTITYDLPLPIELSTFTAIQVNGNNVRLNWTTLSEVNNYGFYIQRRAEGDPEFQTLANSFVAGNGTTNIPHHYEYIDGQVSAGSWFYRLKQVDFDSDVFYSDPVHVDVLTGVEEGVPAHFELQQNYPNPFNPSTEIGFSVESAGPATVQVLDILGQNLLTLFDGTVEAGRRYLVKLNGSKLASGVYFYILRSGTKCDMKRLVVMK